MKTLYQIKSHILLIALVGVAAVLATRVHIARKSQMTAEIRADKYTYLLGNPENGIKGLKHVYVLLNKYRVRKEGRYPDEMSNLITDIIENKTLDLLHKSLV